ncbi:hypothetical protein [Mesorhizobium sp. AR02]|uniref:hypothetical protein n=1 Tax=Mesorhizobium sp. AR02 TaxID=2865837 RepID=UPI002B269F4F|nr:hypothetical protein [Mesorhizobium sp. AR02]
MGVNLFFLISGFVIAWAAEGRSWTEFAVARLAHLYPGFLVCMTASFIVQSVAADPKLPYEPSRWVANLFIVAAAFKRPFMDGVYWSIVFEIVFYSWIAVGLFFGVFCAGSCSWWRHGCHTRSDREYPGIFNDSSPAEQHHSCAAHEDVEERHNRDRQKRRPPILESIGRLRGTQLSGPKASDAHTRYADCNG